MNKYAKHNHRKYMRQNAERLKEITETKTQGTYQPPNRENCYQRETTLYKDTTPPTYITQRIWTQNNQITEYALDLTITETNEKIARADIKHGHAHIHILENGKDTGEPIHVAKLDTLDDVHTSLYLTINLMLRLATMALGGANNEPGN